MANSLGVGKGADGAPAAGRKFPGFGFGKGKGKAKDEPAETELSCAANDTGSASIRRRGAAAVADASM